MGQLRDEPWGLPPALARQALEQHRVALGGVGADQQHQIGEAEVVAAAGAMGLGWGAESMIGSPADGHAADNRATAG